MKIINKWNYPVNYINWKITKVFKLKQFCISKYNNHLIGFQWNKMISSQKLYNTDSVFKLPSY